MPRIHNCGEPVQHPPSNAAEGTSMSTTTKHPDGEPWQWPETTWRKIVGRGGRNWNRKRATAKPYESGSNA